MGFLTSQCDFCASQAVQWSYPAESFVIPMPSPLPDWGSDGPWAACACCHDLIEAGKVEDLLRRSIETCPAGNIMEIFGVDLASMIGELHAQFHKRRLGKPIRIGLLN